MDRYTLAQERIARKHIEEERRARPVTYLSSLQKQALLKASKGGYEDPYQGVMYDTPEGAALNSLEDLGLVKLVATKGGLGGHLTNKGRLLLQDNPKLKFPKSDEARWKVSETRQIILLIIAVITLLITIILNWPQLLLNLGIQR